MIQVHDGIREWVWIAPIFLRLSFCNILNKLDGRVLKHATHLNFLTTNKINQFLKLRRHFSNGRDFANIYRHRYLVQFNSDPA
jgi:hypothetical protein